MRYSIEELLKQTFTSLIGKKFLAFSLVLFLASSIIALIVSFLLGLFGVFLSDSPTSLSIPWPLLIIAFALLFVIDILFKGIGLNLARQHLSEGKALSFKKCFQNAKERLAPALIQQIILGLVVFAFALLVFSPVILSAINFLATPENSADFAFALENIGSQSGIDMLTALASDLALANLSFLIIGAGIFLIALLAFAPALLVLQQVVFFEKVSAIESFKKAIHYGFRNFFKNFAFAIIFIVPVIIAALILGLVSGVIAPQDETSALRLGIGFLFNSIIQLVFFALFLLFSANIYRLDASSESRPEKQAVSAGTKKTK